MKNQNIHPTIHLVAKTITDVGSIMFSKKITRYTIIKDELKNNPLNLHINYPPYHYKM